MKVQRHAPPTFLRHAGALIDAAPAENHLLHALAERLMDGNLTLNAPPVLVTVNDGDTPVMAALRTPPGNLVVSTGSVEAAKALAIGLNELSVSLPGVTGPKPVVEAFVSQWGKARELVYLARVRKCDAVTSAPVAEGTLRLADEDELDVIAGWMEAFRTNVFSDASDPRRFAKRRIADEAVFVWDNGGPVSMACIDGLTTEGVRVDWIYTPDAQRGKGYAKSAVSALTGRMIEGGRKFCIAHAVTADARANALLDRVGYRAVSINATWRFTG